eukprot:1781790-Amphidinium_carterae.3
MPRQSSHSSRVMPLCRISFVRRRYSAWERTCRRMVEGAIRCFSNLASTINKQSPLPDDGLKVVLQLRRLGRATRRRPIHLPPTTSRFSACKRASGLLLDPELAPGCEGLLEEDRGEGVCTKTGSPVVMLAGTKGR